MASSRRLASGTFLWTGVASAAPVSRNPGRCPQLSTVPASPGMSWSFPQSTHSLCTTIPELPTDRTGVEHRKHTDLPTPRSVERASSARSGYNSGDNCGRQCGQGGRTVDKLEQATSCPRPVQPIHRSHPVLLHSRPRPMSCADTGCPHNPQPLLLLRSFSFLEMKNKRREGAVGKWTTPLGARRRGRFAPPDPDAAIETNALRWNSRDDHQAGLRARGGRAGRVAKRPGWAPTARPTTSAARDPRGPSTRRRAAARTPNPASPDQQQPPELTALPGASSVLPAASALTERDIDEDPRGT